MVVIVTSHPATFLAIKKNNTAENPYYYKRRRKKVGSITLLYRVYNKDCCSINEDEQSHVGGMKPIITKNEREKKKNMTQRHTHTHAHKIYLGVCPDKSSVLVTRYYVSSSFYFAVQVNISRESSESPFFLLFSWIHIFASSSVLIE